MPSIRHTDPGPAARPCPRCRTTHRAENASGIKILCPPVNSWLVAGTPLKHTQKGTT